MTEYRSKTFRYMSLTTVPHMQSVIQTMLQKALLQRKIAASRQETLDAIDKSYRLINTKRTVSGCLCGVMCSYTQGQHQAAMDLDLTAEEFKVEQIAPKVGGQDGRRSEFIDGMLFFAMKGNHLVLVGSHALQSKQFEQHLNWLLGPDETANLAAGQQVLILDPDTQKRRKARLQKVKSIQFTSSIPVQPKASTVIGDKVSYRPTGKAWQAMVEFLRSSGITMPAIDFDESLHPEDLSVTVEIENKRRVDAIEGATPILDPLANAFTHHADVPFVVYFRDGTSLRGDALRVTRPHSVTCVNGIPVVNDLFAAMIRWLETVIARPDIV